MNKTILISIIVLFVVACNPINCLPTYDFIVEICNGPTEVFEVKIPEKFIDIDNFLAWIAPYKSNHKDNVYKFYCHDLEVRHTPSTISVNGVGYGLHSNKVFAINKVFFVVVQKFENIKIKNTVVNFIIK